MKSFSPNLKSISKFWFLSMLGGTLVCTSCEEDPNFAKEINASSIDDLISQVGTFDPPPAASLVELSSTTDSTTTDSNGTTFNCSAKEYQLNSVFETLTLSAFDDRAATNTASLYPGSLVQLQDFIYTDELNGIGTFERQPIEVSSTLGDIRLVENPAQRGNVDKQIKDMESLHDDFAANVKFETTESYSMEQSMLQLGINGSYLGNSVKSKLKVESTVEKKNIFIKFLQVYHTVSIANPVRPSEFFGPSVTVESLQNITDPSNPIGFISEVAYGRVLVGKFTYSGSKYSTAAELDIEIRKGLGKIEAGVDYENSSDFSNSTFEVAILGGSANEASQVSGNGMEAVQAAYNFIKNGGSDPSLGVPIQYKIKYLADNSTVASGGVARYEIPDCDFVATSVDIRNVRLVGLDPPGDPIATPSPDPYFQLKVGNTTLLTSATISHVDPDEDLPVTWDITSKGINRPVNSTLHVHFWDDDGGTSGDDDIGGINFTFSSYPDYRSTIRKQVGELIIELDVTWK
ncbi:MAG: thiol-activated cytolysin family protein [Cyclobacteriaceae bacterium]|nr:thiol-activated cytolysin family protein [Cyclobacteriaceae bacterium]